MNTLRRGTAYWLGVVVCLSVSIAHAQGSGTPRALGTERLFQGFEFDGTLIPTQWWEGGLALTEGDGIDLTTVEVVAAMHAWENIEVGGRVGFGSSDTPSGVADGSGATDLDVWGKWRIGTSDPGTDVSVGAVLTVPTGDDSAGLGTDAFSLALFGAVRHALAKWDFNAYFGLRLNQDGQILGVDLDGKTSGIAGVGVVLPITQDFHVVGEANLETERFDQMDSDIRVLGGFNWHVARRGVFRTALAAGLTDGAPDWRFSLAYAFLF